MRWKPTSGKMKFARQPAGVRGLLLAALENISGVGQPLSTVTAHGAFMQSEIIPMPPDLGGRENAGGILRRSLRIPFPACTRRPVSESTLA